MFWILFQHAIFYTLFFFFFSLFNIPSFLDILGKELAESGRSYHSFMLSCCFFLYCPTFYVCISFYFLRPRDTRLVPELISSIIKSGPSSFLGFRFWPLIC